MTFYMDEGTRKRYRIALRDASSAVAAAGVAAQFAGRTLDSSTLKLIAHAVLGHADDVLAVVQAIPREAWENERYMQDVRRRMRHQLLDAAVTKAHVPISLPTETVRYLRMGAPYFGAEVPETGDWDTAAVSLGFGVRTPPIDRAAAVQAGLLTGGTAAS